MISSLSNPLVKQARALRRQRKARAESGLFLVEGIHHVGEAVEAGWDIDSILYAPDILTSDFAGGLISEAERRGLGLQAVSAQVMESLADKENPQGILAIVRQRGTKLANLESVHSGVAVVSPQDPGNVGTLLRTLDAVGAGALFLLEGGVDPYHPTSVRASMGAIFWIPILQTSFIEFLDWSKSRGLELIGTSAHAGLDYRQFNPGRPWLLVLGSEQKGLSSQQLDHCDAAISLPMRGRASSLNLSVAAAVLLYQFTAKE